MVDDIRTSRVSSADNTPGEALTEARPESFRWLRPVYSKAKRSQVRGLMCATSNNITRFYDRDVTAALNIRRCAVGPGPRPTELTRQGHVAQVVAQVAAVASYSKSTPTQLDIQKPPQRACVWVGATRGALATSTHTRIVELKWALGTLAVAFTMLSSQPVLDYHSCFILE
ncbi:hypothetical protein HaLaN_16837 [Haematococcus lacustris]|uniref:Uncharacterized protein n=1 Tax=Haematococcus lacustris TaxID=44745 RepID=A0A699ZMT7_HAELA|nr:hypothetical protein HaLaN_16837 [Haematococcus lacustris]